VHDVNQKEIFGSGTLPKGAVHISFGQAEAAKLSLEVCCPHPWFAGASPKHDDSLSLQKFGSPRGAIHMMLRYTPFLSGGLG
jgi:hypothetical protein